MRVLVTGAGDFLGRRLLEALRHDLSPGSRILGIDRRPQPPLDGVTFLDVDPFDAGRLTEAVAAFDPTFVFHLAALASVARSSETPAYAWRADLLGTLNLAEAVARTRATLVFLSSTVVYGEAFRDRPQPDEAVTPRPDTISGRTKNACEYILRDVLANAGVKHLVLRPSNYIGPGQSETFVAASFAGQIARIERGLAPPTVAVGDLAAARDFIDVSDVTAACLRVLDQTEDLPDGGIFNVGTGVVTPVSAILDMFRGLTEAPFTVEVAPERTRPAGVRSQGCDPSAFTAATGWMPAVPLAQSLQAMLDAARARVG
ncbi:NAD-dependent epimerase/dehydratase family protein [Methylobacterium sp. E-066]|uniref:NAD-dependent epimerase/dehydratase family protein n=1 Tax=Methylobacterium sp. E-066 TaxID=2836584 RepID=UPI001FBBC873|nr:NAD-dependent epimerase/dehydratase family protein [Methylobacterium sp. E-066]MCJ2144197.1 NAD-dependent epimerase/dehydratase family protein [Methylobacterium sp. E-066]